MNKNLAGQVGQLAEAVRAAGPLLRYQAPADDAEAVALFAAARAGDPAAVARLPALLRDRGWVDWIGDLGSQATHKLVWRVARNDSVLKAGLNAKVADLWKELAGDSPSVLERLLVRRVVNGWLLTHAVEVELCMATEPGDLDRLDKKLGRAQRRLAEAVRELARVRRLQPPAVLARLQVNVAAAQQVTA